ncbi:DUF2911 domain-containing protein [Aureibaculum marinum]|uniref:DUF2911 domain-containing protein n=1 Tax=Aureibaculum marinum TaxID=2487930 RepID=A0A3N4NDJ8_9FLAO|nr:DUF2911 domain-containing protein [Aureibaculum marinum]RPD94384.1 DUF2911 domain-containing protein [Aureibaculum marinum]
MNYKKLLILFLCMGTMGIGAQIKTPAASPASTIKQTVGLTDVTVDYSRPSMRNRVIFGDVVPYNKIWRTGANARTKITFSDDVTINGNVLKKGTYAIFTKPTATAWDIYFYTEYEGSGAINKLDESKIAFKTTAKTQSIPVNIETFTITIDDLTDTSAVLGFMWEKTYVGLQFTVPTDIIATKSIETIMNGPSANDYHRAANYYRTSGKDLKQALIWSTKATEMNKNAFWMFREKSLIHAALGDKKAAIETAKKSLEIAEKAGSDPYIKMNKESIKEWSK